MCICIFIGLGLDFNPFNLSPPLLPTRSCASSPDSLSPARDTASRRRPIRADSCRRSPSPSPPASRHPAGLPRSLVASAASSRARLLLRTTPFSAAGEIDADHRRRSHRRALRSLGVLLRTCAAAALPLPRVRFDLPPPSAAGNRPRRRRRLDRRRLLP
jgi:hypothetical protein